MPTSAWETTEAVAPSAMVGVVDGASVGARSEGLTHIMPLWPPFDPASVSSCAWHSPFMRSSGWPCEPLPEKEQAVPFSFPWQTTNTIASSLGAKHIQLPRRE